MIAGDDMRKILVLLSFLVLSFIFASLEVSAAKVCCPQGSNTREITGQGVVIDELQCPFPPICTPGEEQFVDETWFFGLFGACYKIVCETDENKVSCHQEKIEIDCSKMVKVDSSKKTAAVPEFPVAGIVISLVVTVITILTVRRFRVS